SPGVPVTSTISAVSMLIPSARSGTEPTGLSPEGHSHTSPARVARSSGTTRTVSSVRARRASAAGSAAGVVSDRTWVWAIGRNLTRRLRLTPARHPVAGHPPGTRPSRPPAPGHRPAGPQPQDTARRTPGPGRGSASVAGRGGRGRVTSGQVEVHPAVRPDVLHLLLPELAAHLPGDTGDEAPGRDVGVLRDERARGDERPGADAGTVEDGGAHPHEDVVLDGAAVQDRPVADGDAGAHVDGEPGIGVDHDVVLEVAPRTDPDGVAVGAQDGAVPDAHLLAELDIGDEDDPRRGPGGLVDDGALPVQR